MCVAESTLDRSFVGLIGRGDEDGMASRCRRSRTRCCCCFFFVRRGVAVDRFTATDNFELWICRDEAGGARLDEMRLDRTKRFGRDKGGETRAK